MKKFGIDNFDPNNSHSINISVYKPDGILSFWNWFTRKNKNESQRKNIKFKINKEDLDKIKQSGFDFQTLQNLDLSNKDKSTKNCNMFAIPKTDIDPRLIKSLLPTMNSKKFVKRLISKSTISIRSKESYANLKYVHTVRSQKSVGNSVKSSKTSFKVSMRSNTNVNSHPNQQPRNVFLKSVPTTVLKSNTKKLLIVGKVKSPNGNRTTRVNAPETFQSQQYANENSNVIPMLLTRMKSMEDQLSDIESATKRINNAVSQRNVITKTNSQNELSNNERNRQKVGKCVASHKIYSKNIHAPRKNKKNRPNKLKNKSNTNIFTPNDNTPLKPKPHNKGFAFNYFSDSSSENKNPNDSCHTDVSHNQPGFFVNQYGFPLPKNVSRFEFSPETPNNVGCDFIMNVVKALTETKGSTNLQQMDSSITRNKPQYPNISSALGVINLGGSNLMSKTTFDWKHGRVSTSSEPQILGAGKPNDENIKVKKNISATFRADDVSHNACERNDILNQIINPNLNMPNQLLPEPFRSTDTNLLGIQKQTKTMGSDEQNCHLGNTLETITLPLPDLEVKECKQRNDNLDNNSKLETQLQKKSSTQVCLHKVNSAHSSIFSESKKETNKLSLEQKQPKTDENFSEFPEKNLLNDVREDSEIVSSTEKRQPNLHPSEARVSEINIDPGTFCSVSIKQNAVSTAFANSPEKQFKRTTISCSNAKKEPKVSITILVQDGVKDEVEMKTNILKDSEAVFKDNRIDQSLKEEYSPPLSSCGPRGDQLSTVQSSACKTESVCSLEHLSSVSCTVSDKNLKVAVPKMIAENPYFSAGAKKNFFVEVKDEGKKTTPNLGAPGTYLNHEKRKVLEEKVLGFKNNKSLMQTVYEKEPVSPTRSCSNISNRLTPFSQVIETSFIHQETSFSTTKVNISKEKNKFNSKTSLKPLSCKRCPISDESLNAENNFDISTQCISQKFVTYRRENNVANYNGPKFTPFRGRPLGNAELENINQPFVLVHALNNSLDNSKDHTNDERPKLWQNGVGLNIREDPIFEVSEDESVVEHFLDKQKIDEKNGIEIKTSHKNILSSLNNKCDKGTSSGCDMNIPVDSEILIRPDQEVQHGDSQAQHENGVAAEAALQCKNTSITSDNGLPNSESKDACSKTNNNPRNRRGSTTLSSSISQTVLSSTLVQTDWSLVGITAEHLHRSNNNSESIDCKKRTVASQTDVMMDQITLMNKDLENLQNCCNSCMKSGQFSELVACNVTVSQGTNLQESPESLLCNSRPCNDNPYLQEMQIAGMLVAVIKEKGSNRLECTTSTLPNEDTLESKLFEHIQTPTSSSSNKTRFRNLKPVSQYCDNKSEESLKNIHEDLPHRCTIPCLTTLSDDTIMSGLSESSNKMASNLHTNDCQTVPEMLAINRGIDSYFNYLDEENAFKRLSRIDESTLSTSDTKVSPFCKVVEDINVDDEETSQEGNRSESLTSLCLDEAVGDSITEQVNTYTGFLDRLYDFNEQFIDETKFEHVFETKNESGITKVKESKFAIRNVNAMNTMKREFSCIDKCNDYKCKYLSIDRYEEEKKR